DIIMLDNMEEELMKEAVELIDGRAIVEASGEINLSTVVDAAKTGVDVISIGALTHSIDSLDISLDLEGEC
ncbi:MAG: nicotinate-nucleotide diphosphorylase (carboxylating), partial [Halanaerobacter sp.]